MPSRRGARAFEGLSSSTFTFFAELATHNDRGWFTAHADLYRAEVDRPWRLLIAAVAAPLAERLPDVDAAVKTGRVLSRIQLQWPRPGAAYRTGLRATFAAQGAGRRPDCCAFVALDADGVRAGVEVQAGSEAWRRVMRHLEADGWPASAAGLRWWLAGEEWPGGAAGELAAQMQGRRRGSLRLAAVWPSGEAVAAGAGLADRVWGALAAAVPVYEWGAAAAAQLAGVAEASAEGSLVMPERAPAAGAVLAGPGADGLSERPVGSDHAARQASLDGAVVSDLPRLPRALRQALARKAAEEGVTVEAFILYVLTQAAAG